MVAAATLNVLVLIIVLFLAEPPRHPGADGREPLVHRAAIPLSLGFLACLAAVSGFLAFASIRAEDIGLSTSSVALALYGVIIVICRLGFATVPDRVPVLPLATGCLVSIAAGTVSARREPHI